MPVVLLNQYLVFKLFAQVPATDAERAECTRGASPNVAELCSAATSVRWPVHATAPPVRRSVGTTVCTASALTRVASHANLARRSAGGNVPTFSAQNCAERCVIANAATSRVPNASCAATHVLGCVVRSAPQSAEFAMQKKLKKCSLDLKVACFHMFSVIA